MRTVMASQPKPPGEDGHDERRGAAPVFEHTEIR